MTDPLAISAEPLYTIIYIYKEWSDPRLDVALQERTL